MRMSILNFEFYVHVLCNVVGSELKFSRVSHLFCRMRKYEYQSLVPCNCAFYHQNLLIRNSIIEVT